MEKLILSIPFFAANSHGEFVARATSANGFESGPYPEGFNLDGKLDCIVGFNEFEKLQRISKDDYQHIIILFRAIVHNDQVKHLIIGFYETDKLDLKEIAPGKYQITAQKAHFVTTNESVDVSDKIIAYNLQNKILRSNSQNHPEYAVWLNDWYNNISSKENKFFQYKDYCLQLRQKSLT
ncbi:MAG: hypothetical protein ACPLW6_07265 [Desulfurella sp.]|uniref:Uncharacterized protein n=1 Tax=Desulfurella multipotens TaxID=79269 RepID=A0A1G6QZG1_9BACT|nr:MULTISPECIES: hypothetical protein [Desulfurella]PMP66821.1 MAG: hypothetical protein C0192_04080 [Desulfurella multipotens]PMP90044.1 MAG: hypothetical protein C0173_04895 [Desulfurella sp.]SDC97583.1 hypothetical protein SAMN05660835_01687 [Desulfurella multipotens]HEX13509.1 hypothetical protein [Desulfurella acetivorans]